VAAKYILAALSVIFLALAVTRLVRLSAGTVMHPQAKAWLLVGIIFGAVSVWLFLQAA
jgi:hypothetical protein